MTAQELAELSYHIVCLRSLGYRTARDRGPAPREYELLLAVKALPPETRRGIGELAEWLNMQHHGVVELATRLEGRGLLRRYHDQHDGRHARLALTPQGARLLRELVAPGCVLTMEEPSPAFGASSPGCRKMATAAERRGIAIEMGVTVAQARSDLTYD